MDSTPVLAACDVLLKSITSTTRALKYPNTPVTDYFRSRDIQLFKGELEKLCPVLHQLSNRHLCFPQNLIVQLVSILHECDTLRRQSHTLLDTNVGDPALSRCTNPRNSWTCFKRDEAFLLRHRLLQHRAVLEATMAIANLITLKAIVSTATFSKRAVNDVGDQLQGLKRSLASIVGEDFQFEDYSSAAGPKVDGPMYLRRSLVALRAALHAPRDKGITSPAPELLMFVDRLLLLAVSTE